MRSSRKKIISRLLQQIPGFQTFGIWSTLPIFFITGAALEFVMINWRVGEGESEVNFYKIFKHRQAEEIAQKRIDKYLKEKQKN